MKKPLSLLLFCLVLACQNPSSENAEQAAYPPEPEVATSVGAGEVATTISTDSLWQMLVFQQGGCLTGGQYVRNGRFGNPECVMTYSKQWQDLFTRDPRQVTGFLLTQLADTSTTRIHTCPFFEASAGEVAVYGLQFIYQTNWFDFGEFAAYKKREGKSATDNHQAWLKHILEDEQERKVMINCWKRESGY